MTLTIRFVAPADVNVAILLSARPAAVKKRGLKRVIDMKLLPYIKTPVDYKIVPATVVDIEMDSELYWANYAKHYAWESVGSRSCIDDRYLHPRDVKHYFREHDVPYREVFEQGQSIGCKTYMLVSDRYWDLERCWPFEPWCAWNTVWKLAAWLGY